MFGMQMGRMGQTGSPSWLRTLYSLFASGEQGAWYDPSDLPTLFQDTAGTTPVTAVEQAVALMLDKSGRGNHASQATSTKRPKYSRRVNLLTKTEDFSNAAWTTGKSAGASVASNTAIAPNGELTADTVTFAASTDYLYQPVSSFNAVAGSSIVLKYCSKVTGRLIDFGGATPAGTDVHIYIDIGGGWYEHKTTRTFSVSVTGTVQIIPQGTIAGAGSFALWGASLTLGTDAHLPYQWVNTATDYDADPAKFPGYLSFDGVDDALQTGNIDFTGTDKMTVWAGSLNTGATGYHLLSEFGQPASGDVGTFSHFAALDAVGRVAILSKAGASEGQGRFIPVVPPVLDITSYALDASKSAPAEAMPVLRKNGQSDGISYSGTFSTAPGWGNHPLYIGARAGTSLYFNGRIYSLIVRGAQSSLSQIEAAELHIRGRMKL